ncbi:sensor histidine kinase [Aeromicrobium sp.]|uniref:sensor histidine kinase n=1 Tax=Aeromicrobium sp. TaxID=1871063 RepID=UPI003C31D2D9
MTAARTRAWDALVVLLVVGVLFEVLTTDVDVPLELSVPIGLVMTVPFLWAQRWPLPVAAIVLGAWLVQSYTGDWDMQPQSELLPAALAFWSLGAYVPNRARRWAFGLALAALVAHRLDDAIVMAPLMAGVYGSGRLMRSREQLAEALQQERAHAERYAVAEERARIARELHDVVGHAIATMTVQAGAERMALGQSRPETSRVLDQIEVTGRQALHEMRRMLGLLRSDDTVDFTPQPGLAQVDALAERMALSGLGVDVHVEGASGPVSPGVDISAYRVVQEALTNVLKHAEAVHATVRVRQRDGELEIEVTDDGTARPMQASSRGAGQGQGLTGMRERVALYGGSLEAGPAPAGGWRLIARLPNEAGLAGTRPTDAEPG